LIEKLIAYLVTINLLSFLFCIYDKRAAVKGRRRISEKALFALSFAGGAAGMYAGMLLVRHKTKHKSFMIGIPLLIILHAALLTFLLYVF